MVVPTDQSSILFPQVSDLDLVSISKNELLDSVIIAVDHEYQHHQYDEQSPLSTMSFHGPTINVRTTTTTTIPSSSQTGSSNGNRRVTIPSFEEWKKQIRHSEETNDNNKKPKRKSTRGAPNRGQEMIDSVDGGFSDDVGSVFDNGDPNGPVSTAENTYEEGEYIAPQKRQQDQQQSNKKQFAKVPLKSLKERFNYAWTICAATVRDVNKEARGAQSILFESKDQYLLNKCSADKFVIINLCEEILIDTIVLANFEFFSSTFKDFRVYVSNTYPTKDWQLLGQWQARNTRDLQVFKVQDSIGWFEYMKIEFLTHYGNEYYCPLSLVRVHGMPMMEYYNAVESQGLFGNGEIESVSDQHLWPADVREDIIHPQIVTNTSEWFPSKEDMDFDDDVDTEDNGTNDKNITTALSVDGDIHSSEMTMESIIVTEPVDDTNKKSQQQIAELNDMNQPENDNNRTTETERSNSNTTTTNNNDLFENKDHHNTTNGFDLENDKEMESHVTSTTTSTPVWHDPGTMDDTTTKINNVIDHITVSHDSNQTLSNNSSLNDDHLESKQQEDDGTTITATTATTTTTILPTTDVTDAIPSFSNDTRMLPDNISNSTDQKNGANTIYPSIVSPSTVTATATSINNMDDNRPKNVPNIHNKEPSTQESIYKIIMKRLNALEANATLSQRYMDEQNNMLNDVFTEMEKRHQDQLIYVLDRLNETASNRIDGMKRRYEQSYEELKHQMESDMRDMTAKISILTDQISFEKRVSMAQLAVIITLFVFLALSRGTLSTLSPIMIAQAEERKRRESDATTTKSSVDGNYGSKRYQTSSHRRDGQSSSSSSTSLSTAASVAAMTRKKLDSSSLSLSLPTKIKLDMDGRKAASLDALKLHLAQQTDLLPKHISQSTSQPPPSSTQQSEQPGSLSSTVPLATTTLATPLLAEDRQTTSKPQRSISLQDITKCTDTIDAKVNTEQDDSNGKMNENNTGYYQQRQVQQHTIQDKDIDDDDNRKRDGRLRPHNTNIENSGLENESIGSKSIRSPLTESSLVFDNPSERLRQQQPNEQAISSSLTQNK